MKRLLSSILLLGLAFALVPASFADTVRVLMATSKGNITLELDSDKAPQTVENFLRYANEGFYQGTVFHRVIDGFMAQTGDPTGTGMGGSDLPDIPAEFSQEPFQRGTVGMARSSNPDSANSQFFIMFAEGSFLNGQYTVWGQVSSGMDCIDQINKGEPPANPDQIIKMTVK